MKLSFLKILFGALIVLAVASCRTAPVYNVADMAHGAPPSATLADVAKAIKGAGASLGWSMKELGPGHIEAKLPVRSHMAVTDVRFDTKTFSIVYKDSVNLRYDSTRNIIHSNYTGWVQNLQNAILAQTSTL